MDYPQLLGPNQHQFNSSVIQYEGPIRDPILDQTARTSVIGADSLADNQMLNLTGGNKKEDLQHSDVRSWFILRVNQLKELIEANIQQGKNKEDENASLNLDLLQNVIKNTHNENKFFLFEVLFSFFKTKLKEIETQCSKKKKFIQELKKFSQKIEKEKQQFNETPQPQPKPVKKVEEKIERKKLKKLKNLQPTYQDSGLEPLESGQSSPSKAQDTAGPTPQNQLVPETSINDLASEHSYTVQADPSLADEYRLDYDGPSSIAYTRGRRNVKKPIYTYESKIAEDKNKSGKKLLKKERSGRNEPLRPADPKFDTREEIAYAWRDWDLYFHQLLNTLQREDFLLLIRKIGETYPECISFESGSLELKIGIQEIEPSLGKRADSRINMMKKQVHCYQVFSEYISQIKEVKKRKSEVRSQTKIEEEGSVQMQTQTQTQPQQPNYDHMINNSNHVGNREMIKMDEEMKNEMKIEDINDLIQGQFQYPPGMLGNQIHPAMDNELEEGTYDNIPFGNVNTYNYYGGFNQVQPQWQQFSGICEFNYLTVQT